MKTVFGADATPARISGLVLWGILLGIVIGILFGPLFGESTFLYIFLSVFSIFYLIISLFLVIHFFLLTERDIKYLSTVKYMNWWLMGISLVVASIMLVAALVQNLPDRFWYFYEISFLLVFGITHAGMGVIATIIHKRRSDNIEVVSLTKIQSEFDNTDEVDRHIATAEEINDEDNKKFSLEEEEE
jgi:hypothetical protein